MAIIKPKVSRERPTTDSGKLGKELLGLFAVFFGLLLILSLATFDGRDPWLNHVVSGVSGIRNKAGLFGAYLAGFLYDMIGLAAWVVPLFFCIVGARRILNVRNWPWWRWIGFMLLAVCISIAGASRDLNMADLFVRNALPPGSGDISSHGGGIVGHMLYTGMVGWLSTTGAFMIWLFILLLAIQMITGLSWITLSAAAGVFLWSMLVQLTKDTKNKRIALRREREERFAEQAARLPEQATPAQSLSSATPAPSVAPDEVDAFTASEDTAAGTEGRFRINWPAGVEETEHPARFLGHLQEEDDADNATPHGGHEAFALVSPEENDEPSSPSIEAVAATMPEAPLPFATPDDTHHQEPSSPLSVNKPELLLPFPAADPAPSLFAAQSAVLQDADETFEEEDNLPPWVRDFEEDRIGVQAGTPLAEAFRMPEPALASPQIAEQVFAPVADAVVEEQPCSLEEKQPSFSEAQCEQVPDTANAEPLAHSVDAPLEESSGPSLPSFSMAPTVSIATARNTSLSLNAVVHGGKVEEPPLTEIAPVMSERSKEPVPDVSPVAAPADPGLSLLPEPLFPHESSTPLLPETILVNEPPVVPSIAPAASPSSFAAAIALVKKPERPPLPPLDLLEAAATATNATPRSVLEEKGVSLMTCLKDFGVQGELVGITPGPVVTMFEVRPAPGVRVSRIANLSDDLALALKAVAVRIQAPVPGTDTVGIEIPNEVRQTVCLKELLSSQLFQDAKSRLTLALGKDIAGLPAVADLATMPHLLVAGATGAGKSVGINSIILSILYKARPDEVKLLLIDPKRVEMAIYADLPHLVHPVVTEMPLAKNALEWAVAEMERRYTSIAKAGVRTIADYNVKVRSFGNTPPSGMEDLEFIPQLVIIIDELADLMLVAAKEVETSIVRLAQLARAAGIHLILATQRPSVDVVTGLIKANFPCRIAFQVTSKHDSRTILDAVGAEHLLGKGDMLFKPGGGKFRRMHGAFVSDKNVNAVVDYWRSQQQPDYQLDFSDWSPESGSGVLTGNGGGGGSDVASDPIYAEAVEFVRQQGKASISLIQRKFRIGFNKAARFVEQMEQDGVIGPADGSRPRLVIR